MVVTKEKNVVRKRYNRIIKPSAELFQLLITNLLLEFLESICIILLDHGTNDKSWKLTSKLRKKPL